DAFERGDAASETGVTVSGEEAADQLVLELGDNRRREVDLFEERVNGTSDLCPGPLAGLLDLHRPFAHPEPVAGEVLVRALLEERERREREAAHAVERRLRKRYERRQLRRRRRRNELLERGEERQLAFLLLLRLGLRRRGLGPVAVEANEQAR